MSTKNHVYRYPARVLRVVDGDTVWFDLDMGLRKYAKERMRLAGIIAPDSRRKPGETLDSTTLAVRREEARNAKKRLEELVLEYTDFLVVETEKEGKYGRWLATLYAGNININQVLLEEGYVLPYGK